VAGPVVPLAATSAEGEELLGGGRETRAPTIDATATRVLTNGEPIAGLNGRADDFSWPRGSSADPTKEQRIPTTDGYGSQTDQPTPTAEQKPQALRRVRKSAAPRRTPLSIRELLDRLVNWN
jgi:hypothetical protein